MITDARSEKVLHAKTNNAMEMVWWFGKTSEQYRIAGEVQFIGAGHVEADGDEELATELLIARKQQWGNLSDMARQQFYWGQPGVAHGTGAAAAAAPPAGGRDAEGKVLPVPDTFLLMLLWPKSVKYLRLTDNFAQNDQMVEGKWVAGRVNP
jgi:hypothetical protein